MKKLKQIFNRKTFCGKQYIEESMTKKYGSNWLEECLEGLRDPNVRKDLKATLKL